MSDLAIEWLSDFANYELVNGELAKILKCQLQLFTNSSLVIHHHQNHSIAKFKTPQIRINHEKVSIITLLPWDAICPEKSWRPLRML